MYTWEIEETLKKNNYVLDSQTYIYICDTSKQILRIKYDSNLDEFQMWLKDKDEPFKFKVKKIE